MLLAAFGVAGGLGGVVADDPAAAGVAVQADLLDPEVVADFLVAALAGEGGVGLLAGLAHLYAGDVVAAGPGEVGQIGLGREAGVGDGDNPAQPPGPQIVLDLLDHGGVGGVAGPDLASSGPGCPRG
nr:hypothetical protein [Streptomyces sp. WAC 01325]